MIGLAREESRHCWNEYKRKGKICGNEKYVETEAGTRKERGSSFFTIWFRAKKRKIFFFKFNRIHTYEIPLQTQNYGEIHSSTVFTI